MILFENKKNARLIRQYLNQEVLFENCDITPEAFPTYSRFEEELGKVSKDRHGYVLTELSAGYELRPVMKRILNNYDLVISTQPPSFAIKHSNIMVLFYHHLKIYYDLYDVIEVNGDRVVIGIDNVVTCAININNIEKI